MKQLKTITRTLILLLISGAFLISCNSDDEAVILTPVVTYSITDLDATFFTSGNSIAPDVNWGGNHGTFSLTTPITGLSISTTTGVLNWTKDLPIDTHNIQVLASNSAGQTPINLTINNPLQGVFTGNYNTSFFFEIEFNSDNTALIRAGEETDPSLATGTWTKNGSTISIDYTYDVLGNKLSLSGTLSIGTNAVYSGDWYIEHGSIIGNEGGTFEVILE